MAIGLGTSGTHERRVAPVPPVVPIPIVWPAAHSERGIKRLWPTHACPRGNPPDCASDGRAGDASYADHHCPDTPGVSRGNEQPRQPPDGDTGEEAQLAHLAIRWVPSVATGAEKAICLEWRSASRRKRHRKASATRTTLGELWLSKLTYETNETTLPHLSAYAEFAMRKAQGAAAMNQPIVTATEVRRFDKAVTVRDRGAFLFELDRLVREKVAAATNVAAEATPLTETLGRKAASLRAATSWSPMAAEVQRGRVELLREFERPHNLPLSDFVRLAHKSRQQIYKDIAARRLLALDVGRRGQRIPDWQLEAPGLQLTRTVLQAAEDVDAWTVYRALAEPCEALGGKSPAASANRGNVDATARVVLASLGVQRAERGGADA